MKVEQGRPWGDQPSATAQGHQLDRAPNFNWGIGFLALSSKLLFGFSLKFNNGPHVIYNDEAWHIIAE